MGLFSKLFSRENEPADKAQDGSEPDARPPEKEQDAQSEASAEAQPERNEQRAKAPVAKADPPPLPSHEALEEQPTTRFVAESTKEGVALREAIAEAKAAVAAPQPAAPPPLAEPKRDDAPIAATPPAVSRTQASAPRATAAAEPASQKMTPLLKTPKTKAETPKKAEPTKPAAAAAPRPAPAPAQKAAPPPRAAADEAPRPKRAPKDTLPAFRAPAVPSAPEPLAAEVDAAVDSLLDMSASSPKSSASDEAADQRAVAETFAAVVKVNAHPLRDFMFQLSVGRTPRQWAAACRPVIHPLLEASKQIGAAELTGALLAFDGALARASSEASACIGDASVAALEQAYACMHGQMPEAFARVAQGDGRRLVLLESLLLQVPALHRRTLDKLYAVGLTSLPQLSLAKPDELAAVAGLDLELAQAVVEHIRRFELERSRVDPTALRSHAHERLRTVVRRLEQLQAEFERAEQEESSVRKRAARRGREAAVLELEVLLAELGDLDLLEELKRCPVRTKITRVESYLERPPASA